MADYTAGDLSKLFQGAGTSISQPASGLFSPKRPSQISQSTENTKKAKKRKKKASQEKQKEPANNVDQNSKPEVTLGENKRQKARSKKKKVKESTEVPEGENTKQTSESEEIKVNNVEVSVGGSKKQKSRSKKKKAKDTDGTMQDKDDVKQDKATKTPGFSPPPGIVHESLATDKQKSPGTQKAKKRKTEDIDSDGEEIDAKKSKIVTEKTRMRRDRLKKKDERRTVFIGNLPISVKKKSLMKMFKVFGEIESIRYRCLPTNDPAVPKRVMAIKEDFHPSRRNCVAYVCYKEEESAQKALSQNGKEIEGLHIRVDIAGKVDKSDMKTSVFVGNLAYDLEEEQLREHFEDCGEIENVRIIRDRKTCIGKGFGYVKFVGKDSVSFATKLSGSVLKKRQIRVSSCVSKLKKSAKDEKDKKKKRPKKKLSKKSQDGEDFPDDTMFQGSKKFQDTNKTDNFKSPDEINMNFKSPSTPFSKQNGKTSHIHFGDDDSTDNKPKDSNVKGNRKNFKKDKRPKKIIRPSNMKKSTFHNKLAKKDSKKPKIKRKRF